LAARITRMTPPTPISKPAQCGIAALRGPLIPFA
jgi:hypothetical protein